MYMGVSPFGANNKNASSTSKKPKKQAKMAPKQVKQAEMVPKEAAKWAPASEPSKFTSYGKHKRLAPAVQLEQYKKIFKEANLHRQSLKKQIKKLVRKTKTGITYFEALSLFQKLEPSDKASLRILVEAKGEVIQKLGLYHRLKTNTETLKESSKLLDVEIDFWGGVAETRSPKFITSDGAVRIKMLRPKEEFVHVKSRKKKSLPTIQGGKSKSRPVTLDAKGRAQLGEEPPKKTQAELETEAKEVEKLQAAAFKREGMLRAAAEKNVELKAKYYGTKPNKVKQFISKLPARNARAAQRRKARRPAEIKKEAQDYIRRTQRIRWDIGGLSEELRKRVSDYERVHKRLQAKMKQITRQHASDKQVVIALGILVNLRPERFLVSSDLESALHSALSSKTISNLSGFGEGGASAVDEVNTLLRKQAKASEALMTEAAIKSTALDIVKAEAKGEVPPLRHPTTPEPAATDNAIPWLLVIGGLTVAFVLYEGVR
jgi:hypothetical protein